MASDIRIFTGTAWQSIKGSAGPAGPTVVSADAGNRASLGTDGFLFVPQDSGSIYRTIASETETGTKGDRCWDENWEYRCIATNTWRRWRRFTWAESDPSSGVSVGSGTGAVWRTASTAGPTHATYANGMFAGNAMSSRDGLTWSGNGSAGNRMAYNGGTWLWVDYNASTSVNAAVPRTSNDGTNFTNRTAITGVSSCNSFAAEAFGKFVVFGTGVGVANTTNVVGRYSATGDTGWSASTITGLTAGKLTFIHGVASSPTACVVVGTGASNTATAEALRTTDGVAWTKVAVPSLVYKGVAYGNGVFVAVGTGGVAAVSTDGTTWTSHTMPTANYVGIAFGGGHFVAVATSSNAVARSVDGLNWETVSLPNTDSWTSIVYGSGRFIVLTGRGATQTPRIVISE